MYSPGTSHARCGSARPWSSGWSASTRASCQTRRRLSAGSSTRVSAVRVVSRASRSTSRSSTSASLPSRGDARLIAASLNVGGSMVGNTSGPRSAVIVGGNRIPFARANGPYIHASNQDMLTAALDGLVARFGLSGQGVGEVAAGAVIKHSRDFNLTRESVLGSRLAPTTPAYYIQQACGTGLEAAILVANKIALGQIDAGIAAGVDTTSDAPITLSDELRGTRVRAGAAKSTKGRLQALSRIRPGHMVPEPPRNMEPRTG